MFDIFGIDALSVLVFGPALSAFAVAAMAQLGPSKAVGRWLALTLSILIGLVSLAVFQHYQQAAPAIGEEQYLVAQDVEWFAALGARWTLGIDGISAVMVLLTGLLTPLAILASWHVEDRSNMHLALLLFFETGSMGVFVAMDLMVFFLFYELTLVPMYFLINQWGSLPKVGLKFSGRYYASTKFMIYSFGGTLGMLLATQLIGWSAGTYSIAALTESWPLFRQGEALLGVDVSTIKALAFMGFFVAFSIKVPIWPFHTWLPDAHGEAPTAGSMLLAGIMLKLGAYGFIRLMIPFFPDVWLSEVVLIGVNVFDCARGLAHLYRLDGDCNDWPVLYGRLYPQGDSRGAAWPLQHALERLQPGIDARRASCHGAADCPDAAYGRLSQLDSADD